MKLLALAVDSVCSGSTHTAICIPSTPGDKLAAADLAVVLRCQENACRCGAKAPDRQRRKWNGTRHQTRCQLHRDGRASTVHADPSLTRLCVVAMSHTTNVPLALGAPDSSIAAVRTSCIVLSEAIALRRTCACQNVMFPLERMR